MNMKIIAITLSTLLTITLIVPSLLVLKGKEPTPEVTQNNQNEEIKVTTRTNDESVSVAVYRSEQQLIEQLPLEEYIIGVVASEMPASFELEALKAQALAARTYIVKQILAENTVGLPEGAIVTDTELHQVYKSEDELRTQWGNEFNIKYNKIKEATVATRGEILTYNNEPIAAQFFSTSNGYTENAEAYWSNPFDYLTTVPSPWDENSPKFHDKKMFSISEFESKLGIKLEQSPELNNITERTPGNRVGKITLGNKTFTGREIREKLQLQSTDFKISLANNQIMIETKGYGHGVGMSQYGANGMAETGKTYDEIVKYYYNGVKINKIDSYIGKMLAKI